MPVNSFDDYPMSWKPKLRDNGIPKYQQLAEQLKEDIRTGMLLPGTKLPPQRELADYLDVNLSTITRVYKICANQGLLRGNVGSGTYVAYDINTNIFKPPEYSTPHLIELGALTPETIQGDDAIALLKEMIRETDVRHLFQYNHEVASWQKNAAVKLIERTGFPPDPEHILTASGAQNSIAAIFLGLFKPGDKIGTNMYVYPGLKSAANLFGVRLVPITEENGEMTEEGIEYAVRNEKIKALYVMPDHQNPTTHTMSAKTRKGIAAAAERCDIFVIEDAINSLLSVRPIRPIASILPERTIYVISLSKAVLPSLRLAYLAVPNAFYKQIDNALYNLNLSQSSLLQELAARLILSGRVDELLETRRKGLTLRNRIVDEELAGLNVIGSEECINRWLLLPEGMSGQQLELEALQRGVHIYGSERFTVGSTSGTAAARISICTPPSLEELRAGLKIIKEIVQ
jgi:DNA-binding transcriptional MocR family regulator